MNNIEADRLFTPLARTVLNTVAPDQAKIDILTVLIRELCAAGWDADTLDQFVGDPLMIAASRQLDRTFWCGHEKHRGSGTWSWCQLEFGHDGDHQDEEKRTWTS